ncbi:MAG TPA: two-component sensor histidine kinase [Deltaproteobacteria bacterium]|nr:two-component sensor histidine kinase [Deltaproteobacteria bacterium]HIJ39794.1 two-component sensor histidine kinase [Deltaproteobacteria bacterium]
MKQDKQKKESYYHLLTRNMLLTIIIVSVMPMILVSGIILYQFEISYQEKVHAHLKELVLKHKQNIDTFLREKLDNIRFLGISFSFEELKNEAFLRDRLEALQQVYGRVFVDLGLVNSDGIQVAYAGPFKLGKAVYSDADWFLKAMQSDYFKSDVFLGLRGLPHFIIAVRQNRKGEKWLLRATIDFEAFNNLVENLRIGQTGFAFILNRKAEFQTKPLLELVPDREPYLGFLRDSRKFKDGVRILEQNDSFGNKIIYVAAVLKHGDWLLVYQQRASDAFSDLGSTIKITLALILLGTICIVTTAFFLSKKMVSRVAKADKEKELMNDQIVETGKLASLGEMAAGIAHEINNPVAIMVEEAGWIEDLLEEEEFKKGENLDEFERALKQIRTQGRRCKEITHKLLSFARKTDSRIQDVSINELIEELVMLSEQRAKYSNVTIQADLQKNLPTLRVSQSELQQVLLNLMNNSLDAMEKTGGNLRLTTRMEGNNIIVGDHLVIEVTDNGPGIPAANLAKIFDPFFTTKPVGKGTGLGLSICYGIIKKMGGDIEARSVIDEGATFTVKVPLPKSKKGDV